MKTDNEAKRIARRIRAGVAKAFRRMARAADSKTAYASTVRFYRSGGQAWSRPLG